MLPDNSSAAPRRDAFLLLEYTGQSSSPSPSTKTRVSPGGNFEHLKSSRPYLERGEGGKAKHVGMWLVAWYLQFYP